MNSSLIQLKKASKIFFAKNKDCLTDIIIFGSAMRGKENPADIDILLLFKKKVDKDIEYDLRIKLQKIIKNIALVSRTEKNYKDESFDAREGILFEGYSLIKSRYVSDEFGFASIGMFEYQTINLSNPEKTNFYYALNGRRGSQGMVEYLQVIKLSDNIILVPLKYIESAHEFFKQWEVKHPQLTYKYFPLLVPKRLARKQIIGKIS